MGGAEVASFLCDLFTLSTEPINTQYSKMSCVNKFHIQNVITKLYCYNNYYANMYIPT